MPPAFPGAPAEGKIVVEQDPGGHLRMDDDTISFTGGVTLKSVQYTVHADEGDYNLDTEWATLKGKVTLQGKTVDARTGAIRANLQTGEWHLEKPGTATVKPAFFAQGVVTDNLYLGAQTGQAPSAQGPITLAGGTLTSCNLEHPHYLILAHKIVIYPGKKIVAYEASFQLLGRTLVTFPFPLVLYLDGRTNQFIPVVGYDDVEGYYAKFAFGYLAGAAGSGQGLLNLTTLQGVGIGINHVLNNPADQGTLSAMWNPSVGALTSNLQNHYNFNKEWSCDLTGSYEGNSGYFGSTDDLASSLLLTRKTASDQLQLGYQTTSSFGSGSSTQTTETSTSSSRWAPTATGPCRPPCRITTSAARPPTSGRSTPSLR
jgi:hypothetical protein